MLRFEIDASRLNTNKRRQKATELIAVLEYKFNSEEFKNGILSMPSEYRISEVSKYKNWSTRDIYAHIMSGKEVHNGIHDCVAQIVLDDYSNRFSKVVGYVIPGKPIIYENTKYFDSMSIDQLAGHVGHEWSHLLGFKHSGAPLHYSFSYYVGDLLEKIRMPGAIEVKTKTVCRRTWYTLWLRKKCWLVRV